MGIFNIYIPDIIATKRYMEASSIQTTDVDKIDSSDLENPNMKVSNISIIRNSGGGG
ncbi:hypothetical protein [Helicobacter muridarum]|nr:hypothetical protein [Helicobacter muridarum]STQ85888.1 Uncharacterised protein [Helicobacter muridarum]